jgi:hypothetical protein
MTIDLILTEWCYRLPKGYPSTSRDYEVLYDVLLEVAQISPEEARLIVKNSDYNASKWLGQQVANISVFNESDVPRLRSVDDYFFEGYATLEDDYLVYKTFEGRMNGSMPKNKINREQN